jgi:serine/threonine-protein kinase
MAWLRLPADESQRRLVIHGILGLAGAAAAWLLVAFVLFPNEGAPDAVIVPAVLGLPYDDAARRLSDAGFDPALGESRLSGEAPKSTVLSQAPAAGARVQRGVRVTLDVSAGQERATIPRLEGRTRSAAAEALRDAGLQLGQVTESPSDRARGTVLATRPAVGQVVPAGTAVDLVLSSGPAQLTMPDVVGQALAEVRGTLEQLGLVVGSVQYDSTSTSPSGRVIQQDPSAGSLVPPGTPVTLRVSGQP